MMEEVDIGQRQDGPLEPVIPPCPFCAAEWERYALGSHESAAHPGVITDGSCVLAGQIFQKRQFPLLMKRSKEIEEMKVNLEAALDELREAGES
jgi:hypothetical protein